MFNLILNTAPSLIPRCHQSRFYGAQRETLLRIARKNFKAARLPLRHEVGERVGERWCFRLQGAKHVRRSEFGVQRSMFDVRCLMFVATNVSSALEQFSGDVQSSAFDVSVAQGSRGSDLSRGTRPEDGRRPARRSASRGREGGRAKGCRVQGAG